MSLALFFRLFIDWICFFYLFGTFCLDHPGGPMTHREPLRTYRKLLERTAHRTWEPIGLKWFDGTKTGNQSAKNGLMGAILGTNSSKLAQPFAPTEPLPKRLLYTYIGPLNHRSRTTPFKWVKHVSNDAFETTKTSFLGWDLVSEILAAAGWAFTGTKIIHKLGPNNSATWDPVYVFLNKLLAPSAWRHQSFTHKLSWLDRSWEPIRLKWLDGSNTGNQFI